MDYRRLAVSSWQRLPAVLAGLLLLVQIAIPWSAPHFTTQDGPSHLYSSNLMVDLVLHHRTSSYSPLYTIQRRAVPNWTANLMLALASAMVGVAKAEALFASFTILLGFVGWCYCARDISPMANAILSVWFLWMGFYNFYLGMLLLPFVAGFYRRRTGGLTWKQTGVLTAGMVLLWFTHPIPTGLAMLLLPLMAAAAGAWRDIRKLAVAFLPTVLFLGIYAVSEQAAPSASSGITPAIAWRDFPMHVFQSASGYAGAQRPLVHFLMWYLVAALVLMRFKEWRSPLGGMAAASIACFLLYLFIPDQGLGGSMVKIRFSWALFVLGGLWAWGVSRLRYLRVPIACVLAYFVATNLPRTARSVWQLNDVAADYVAAADVIPPGAAFVRLHYPTPHAPWRFGYDGMGVDPFFHLDAWVAAQHRSVDLSDYEAITGLFPVVFKKSVDPALQSTLWSLEGPENGEPKIMQWLLENFPTRIRYVVVVGDANSEEAQKVGMPELLAYLESGMCRVRTSASGLVRVYRAAAKN